MSAPFKAPAYQRVVLLQTAAEWAETTDRILEDYETGRETDTGYEKTGNGTSTWAELSYDEPSGPNTVVFDIRDYGAVVDGVTNDAAAIVAAANAAIAAGGGTVYFPTGVTAYSGTNSLDAVSPVNTTANVTFAGAGGADILLATSSVLTFANFGIIKWSNLSFIGTSTSTIISAARTFQFGSCVEAVIENCRFYGLGTTGNDEFAACVLAYNTPLIVRDCFFAGCTAPSAAVVTVNAVGGIRMTNTTFIDIADYKGVTYSTAVKTAGAAWVRCNGITDVVAANRKTYSFVNCTFDEAPLWGVRFDGTAVTRQSNGTVDNCHFNTGVDRGGGAYSGAIYATEMRQVTVKDTTAGFSNNTTDYAVAEFNNIDVVEMDNFRGIYGATYVTFSGTTSRVKLRNCTLAGFVTYPLGWNNSANAFIDADTAMPETVAAAALAPLGKRTHVTGNTNITSITTTNLKPGDEITLIFDGTPTLTDGNNIKAAGNLVATADDTWTGVFDGTNVYETGRAVN